MRFLSTRVHGIIDYLTGGLLIVAPWLFGFADGTAAQWVPVLLGVAIILMSLMTDYEVSVAKVIPMGAHLAVDGLGGALLAVSPWLFGFADRTYLPHLIIGIAEIGLSLVTRTHPDRARDAAVSRY
ncbi:MULTISPECIES: SPW repeat domain-containing protein [Microvirga]|uniref:SPW repeat domain-containing protein n=1 Tax=Microvirga TaxID=186650 RepID=UPI001CFFC0EE|nr:SPW repeat protein [Microvirga lenta]MCB5176063.1 SPW repeat protein [Microvirga lenta]